jgi:hypothetical protein
LDPNKNLLLDYKIIQNSFPIKNYYEDRRYEELQSSKNKGKLTTVLLIIIINLAILPLTVQASTGNIYINRTSASVVGQEVSAGGNLCLYLGSITWSTAQFYLMISTDGLSQKSTGDFQYSAVFDVTNVTASSGSSTYHLSRWNLERWRRLG